MKQNNSIQIKAAFLLIVFSMNTIIGFACAMGADMGFNSKHHHEEAATKALVHIHADGKKHQHPDKTSHHQHGAKEEKGGCCNDGVVKFQLLDKGLQQNNSTLVHMPAYEAITGRIYCVAIYKQLPMLSSKKLLQFFYPPPADIRILIRSFQI